MGGEVDCKDYPFFGMVEQPVNLPINTAIDLDGNLLIGLCVSAGALQWWTF